MIVFLKEMKVRLDNYSILSDTKTAFKAKSDKELQSSLLLFSMICQPWLIKIGSWFLRKALSLRLPVKNLVKKTLFKHFCGGENIDEALQSMAALKEHNIYAVLDYAAEEMDEESDFDHVSAVIRQNIRLASGNRNIRFISLKASGIADCKLLEKVASGQSLSVEEERSYELFYQRLLGICALAEEMDVIIYIDAEESWLQQPVDEMALKMMQRFNRNRAVVFNTYQMYRRDRLQLIGQTLDKAREENFIPGIKIVRGAYMEKEAKRAEQLGYANPLFTKKQETDQNFNEAIYLVLSHPAKAELCVATHNETSTLLALELRKLLETDPAKLQFSQLLGMSDHLTYNLAARGYLASKYLPYGQVEIAIPYLLRRAEENSSVGSQSNRDKQLLEMEIERRKLVKEMESI